MSMSRPRGPRESDRGWCNLGSFCKPPRQLLQFLLRLLLKRVLSSDLMKTSTDRILTTHVGSLPRPQEVVDLIFAQDRNEPIDPVSSNRTVQEAVDHVIRLQLEAGIDIPSDGEQGKISYATYIRHRLTDFEGDSAQPTPQDLDDFPDYRDKLVKEGHSATYKRPVCKGEIKVKSMEPVKEDIARMKSALSKAGITEGFMNSVSPGTVAVFQPNEY